MTNSVERVDQSRVTFARSFTTKKKNPTPNRPRAQNHSNLQRHAYQKKNYVTNSPRMTTFYTRLRNDRQPSFESLVKLFESPPRNHNPAFLFNLRQKKNKNNQSKYRTIYVRPLTARMERTCGRTELWNCSVIFARTSSTELRVFRDRRAAQSPFVGARSTCHARASTSPLFSLRTTVRRGKKYCNLGAFGLPTFSTVL